MRSTRREGTGSRAGDHVVSIGDRRSASDGNDGEGIGDRHDGIGGGGDDMEREGAMDRMTTIRARGIDGTEGHGMASRAGRGWQGRASRWRRGWWIGSSTVEERRDDPPRWRNDGWFLHRDLYTRDGTGGRDERWPVDRLHGGENAWWARSRSRL